MSENAKNDRMKMMAELPIPKVLVKMSLPMMVSFFIQAMYNIVDSMFVARISENALTAVSLAFPMQQIVTAIAVGTSTGVSAVWSRKMGLGDKEKASASIRTMTGISLAFSVIFVFLGLFAAGPLYGIQTNVEEIARMGTTYLMINWCLSFGSIFSKYYEKLLVSAGHATLSMLSMAAGAVFNLIFDPLLIFGIGPFPEMGIAGAAYAMVGGQIFSMIIAILLNMKYCEPVKKDMLVPAYHPGAAREIFRVGLPSIITMGLSSMVSFSINQILLTYSTTATAVYGIWMKLQNFSFMPVFGLNNGMVPIISYNYGKGRNDRVRETLSLAIKAVGVLMVLLVVIFELIPGAILAAFNAGEMMREIGLVCIRACVVSLPFGAIAMIQATGMQALDHARYALTVNMLRQCVFLIGSFALLSVLFHDIKLIWLAVPITDISVFLICCLFYRKFKKKLGI